MILSIFYPHLSSKAPVGVSFSFLPYRVLCTGRPISEVANHTHEPTPFKSHMDLLISTSNSLIKQQAASNKQQATTLKVE
jgi:hypothetical protein